MKLSREKYNEKTVNSVQPVLQGLREEKTFQIGGMDCAACALTIEKGVVRLEGVEAVEVLLATQKMKVAGKLDDAEIASRVRELGYELIEDEPAERLPEPEGRLLFWKYVFARGDARWFTLGLIFILPGLILHELMGIEHWLVDVSSIIALALAGMPVFRSAWQSFRHTRDLNINVLMSVASIGAMLIGAFTEAGMVMVLFSLGETIEGFTGEQTRRAIRSLMELVPQEATKLFKDETHFRSQRVAVRELELGDRILVKPGEKIPMDGFIIEGTSHVDQSSITGESRLIEKETGSDVFASSINGEGALVIEITRRVDDNTISRLIRMVEEAQEKRAPAQRFVDRFARVYTPIVVAVAVLVAVVPPVFFNQPFLNPDEKSFGWLYRGLALLVVGCPCALVISTPVSIISAISNAARHGVLVKGGAFLEELNNIRVFAFDKTGTLTEGKPVVVSLRSVNCIAPEEVNQLKDHHELARLGHTQRCQSCSDLLAVAGAVEEYSEHPLAKAIVSAVRQNNLLRRFHAVDVQALTGRGVRGKVNGWDVLVGSHRYFDDNCFQHQDDCELAQQDARHGLTPLMVGRDDDYLGTITVGDRLRPDSRAALHALKQTGIAFTVMLTGDDTEVAKGVAANVGTDDYLAQLLPAEKVDAVHTLQAKYGKIAMVGDGINDAPALAAADVGIAMGGAQGGSSQAMETADITLMSENLGKLAFLLRLSKNAMHTIYFNVAFSLLVKFVFFILVILGYGTMWMAVVADMGTTLLVTVNGLRLLRRPVPVDQEPA